MSTATISNNPHRRFVTPPPEPLGGPNKRRKERDGDVIKPSSPKVPRFNSNSSSFVVPRPGSPKPSAPRNQLLAGYLAHEFLTKGSLFGEPRDPSRAEAVPLGRRAKPTRKEEAGSSGGGGGGGGEASRAEEEEERRRRYAEVADLVRSGGAHLPGIVNPTQLARFLQL